ncbi:MAG TPA: hypothetical protein VJN71_01180 [Nitrososphaerales archaeon]|nr:hypothetical protein [Nitrososphaerales archaeon]
MASKSDGEDELKEGSADYFCILCFVAFRTKELLNEHMKQHLELRVEESNCHLEATPAGVV